MNEQRVETPLGTVVLRHAHGRDEQIEVELVPAPGCTTRHGHLVRERTYTYPPPPSMRQVRRWVGNARGWLGRPQPANARFKSHFGVTPPYLGRFGMQLRPDSLTISVRSSHQITSVAGRPISGITEAERHLFLRALQGSFGGHYDMGAGAPVWEGPWFISCRYTGCAHPTLVAAMRRYGRGDDGNSIDVFKASPAPEYGPVIIPKGWWH